MFGLVDPSRADRTLAARVPGVIEALAHDGWLRIQVSDAAPLCRALGELLHPACGVQAAQKTPTRRAS